MRASFVRALAEIARKDHRVMVVTPDMGFSVLEKLRADFPDRVINSGIAEQNSVGIAAGLALAGKIVYVYSIVPFVTMRPFEQVRVDVCYQNLPVKLVGSGGGLTYGSLGPTHHSIEDISIMRSLPNMSVLCPGDPFESELCTEFAYNLPGPAYLRLGKGSGDPQIHKSKPVLVSGQGIKLREGTQATILVTGNLLHNAMLAADLLGETGISCGVFSFPVVKPLDHRFIISMADEGTPIFTLEEHSTIGGLGSAVSDAVVEAGIEVPLRKIALPDRFCKETGSQDYLRKLNGLDPQSIAKIISSSI
jgi:transketolase